MVKRLENEVWALDRCCGCGNCVALCSKGMLFWGAGETPTRELREKALGLSHTTLDSCSFCQQLCELGCPQLEEQRPVVQPWQVAAVRTRGIVQSGEPGEVVKHLLVASMAAELIDGAVLPDVDPWNLKATATVATSVGEVVDTLGVPALWAPTLSALNEAVYERQLRSVAVVGTPCVSQAVHKLQATDSPRLNHYRQAVRLNVAIFCTGVYRPELIGEYFGKQLGIASARIKRLEASPRLGVLTAVLWDGSTRTVLLADVDAYTRHGCARCDDYAGDAADIAVGTMGAQDGYSTVIVRSQAGEIALRTAMDFGLLEAGGAVDQVALARAQAEKERRQRAQLFDRMMVMMLDALAEPRKRADVKQAFVRAYGARKAADRQNEEGNCYVTCGQC
jgi:coenzyme F420 hydrogenase subunit beta